MAHLDKAGGLKFIGCAFCLPAIFGVYLFFEELKKEGDRDLSFFREPIFLYPVLLAIPGAYLFYLGIKEDYKKHDRLPKNNTMENKQKLTKKVKQKLTAIGVLGLLPALIAAIYFWVEFKAGRDITLSSYIELIFSAGFFAISGAGLIYFANSDKFWLPSFRKDNNKKNHGSMENGREFADWFNENREGYILDEYKDYLLEMQQMGAKPKSYEEWAKEVFKSMENEEKGDILRDKYKDYLLEMQQIGAKPKSYEEWAKEKFKSMENGGEFADWFNKNRAGDILDEYKDYQLAMQQKGLKPNSYEEWAKEKFKSMS